MVEKIKVYIKTAYDRTPKQAECFLEDLDIANLSVSSPKSVFSYGQLVEGYISYGQDNRVHFQGQVKEIYNELNEKNEDLEIHIDKMSSTHALMEFIQLKQKKATLFLKNAKGY